MSLVQAIAEHRHDDDFRAYFAEAVASASRQLLSHLPFDFEQTSEIAKRIEFDNAGIVAFVGPRVRGLYVISFLGDALKDGDAVAHNDKLGEMANQLAGRVKNQISAMGVSYEVTVPVVMSGSLLNVATVGAQTSLTFECEEGSCYVWALLDIVAPVELIPCAPEERHAAEGEILLF